jgi:hypothetical protein
MNMTSSSLGTIGAGLLWLCSPAFQRVEMFV